MERAIATDRELEALAGNADVQNPDAYKRNARTRIRKRIKRLDQELEELEDVDPELAKALRSRVCPPDEDIETKMDDVMREMQEFADVLEDVIAAEDESIDPGELRHELENGGDSSDTE